MQAARGGTGFTFIDAHSSPVLGMARHPGVR